MNSIQVRLQPRQEDCNFYEHIANFLLELPRAIWCDRTVIFNGNCNNITIEESKSFTNIIKKNGLNFGVAGFSGVGVSVLVLSAYFLGTVIAAPLFFVGMAIKEISLQDIKAKKYHELISSSPRLVELQHRNEILIRKISNGGPTEMLINKLFNLIHDSENDNKEELFKTMKIANNNFSKVLSIVNKQEQIESQLIHLKKERELLIR